MHASLFSNEHINFASSSSRSRCLCRAAANSGSSAAALAVLGSSETTSAFGGVISSGDGERGLECVSIGDDGDVFWLSVKDGVTASVLILTEPLTFGVEGSAFDFDFEEGEGDGVGITGGVVFFKKL